MNFVTLLKMDGQPTVVSIAHIVVMFENGANTRPIMSNGMDIYLKDPLTQVQAQINDALAT